MNSPKVSPEDYIDFLIATPKHASALEAARCQPAGGEPPAHDAFTRLLHRLEPDSEVLWQEVEPQVRREDGFLILDDTVLDKFYAQKIELVGYVWSGKHKRPVKGINLLTLLWTDGDRHVPCDYRLYDKADGKTKNDHFREMLEAARARGFRPRAVLFDSWYARLENLKLLGTFGWKWLTQLQANRRVNPDRSGLIRVEQAALAARGTVVHLEGYGLVKVFLIVTKDGGKEYWATSHLDLTELERLEFAEASWKIEEYHRALKQFTNVERCQARAARAQRNHIGLSLRAFFRLETYSHHTGISWFNAKVAITRDAVRAYLKNPRYHLKVATA
jgi:putative transposase